MKVILEKQLLFFGDYEKEYDLFITKAITPRQTFGKVDRFVFELREGDVVVESAYIPSSLDNEDVSEEKQKMHLEMLVRQCLRNIAFTQYELKTAKLVEPILFS